MRSWSVSLIVLIIDIQLKPLCDIFPIKAVSSADKLCQFSQDNDSSIKKPAKIYLTGFLFIKNLAYETTD